jgi:glycerol dehydrogenase-like iron-containing ADH family enzyme
MQTVEVALSDRRYPIYIGEHLLERSDVIARHLPQKRAALITDTTVAPLYLDVVTRTLTAAGVAVTPIVIPAGEQHKNWQTLNSVFDALLAHRCERKTALIALGGGVIGDLTGFAAGDLFARRAVHPDTDDAARASGLLGWRQDRDQSSSRQKHGRRVLSAACRDSRDFHAEHPARA